MKTVIHEDEHAVTLSPAAGEATAAVIWLHGLGADGHDFVPLLPELRLPDSARIRFTFPHAAVRPVTINNGYAMRAWYDIRGLSPGSQEDEAGIRNSSTFVQDMIRREVAAGIPAQRIVLAGFSQGGAIALHAGLRHGERIGGILALSTYLPLRGSLAAEAAAANRDVPVLMCHGTRDQVIALQFALTSRDALLQAGHAVTWRQYAMGHELCGPEILEVAAWLRARLP